MAAPMIWLARAALLAAAAIGPVLLFALRSARTGNAEQAIDGLGWGLLVTLAALLGFAASFRTSTLGRFGRFAVGLVAVLVIWLLAVGAVNFWPKIRIAPSVLRDTQSSLCKHTPLEHRHSRPICVPLDGAGDDRSHRI